MSHAGGERVVVPHYDFAANARAQDRGTERCFLAGTKVCLRERLRVLGNEIEGERLREICCCARKRFRK
jgi:hypothetical protein